MIVNNALNSRILNTYSPTINEDMLYRKLISLIEQYNRLATVKGLPSKKIPIYTSHINETLIARAINAILNDIDKVTGIKVEGDNSDAEIPMRYGVYDGVFPEEDGEFVIGSWIYTVRNGSLWVQIKDTDITKIPNDLPFNYIKDDTSNELHLTVMNNTFSDCTSLIGIDLRNFNTSEITSMGNLFRGCSSLTNVNLSNCIIAENTNISAMFSGCSSLINVNLSNCDITNRTYMNNMFLGCNVLSSITMSESSSYVLSYFPKPITEWSVDGTSLTEAAWNDSWGDGPVTFTRTIQPST